MGGEINKHKLVDEIWNAMHLHPDVARVIFARLKTVGLQLSDVTKYEKFTESDETVDLTN